MTCSHFTEGDVPERYVRGDLDPPVALAFEEHYFSCEDCFEALRQLRELRDGLESQRASMEVSPRAVAPTVWQVSVAVVAFLLAAGAAWTLGRGAGTGPPDAQTAFGELVAIDPPVYSPVRLRGSHSDGNESFEAAMARYSKEDWAGALPGLRKAANLEPQRTQFAFFLGVCALMAGNTDEAVESLSRAIVGGDTTYIEDSRFFLGKAHLRAGNLTAARFQFQKTVELQGGRSAEARRILDRLGN